MNRYGHLDSKYMAPDRGQFDGQEQLQDDTPTANRTEVNTTESKGKKSVNLASLDTNLANRDAGPLSSPSTRTRPILVPIRRRTLDNTSSSYTSRNLNSLPNNSHLPTSDDEIATTSDDEEVPLPRLSHESVGLHSNPVSPIDGLHSRLPSESFIQSRSRKRTISPVRSRTASRHDPSPSTQFSSSTHLSSSDASSDAPLPRRQASYNSPSTSATPSRNHSSGAVSARIRYSTVLPDSALESQSFPLESERKSIDYDPAVRNWRQRALSYPYPPRRTPSEPSTRELDLENVAESPSHPGRVNSASTPFHFTSSSFS